MKKKTQIFGSFKKSSYLCSRIPFGCKILGSVVKEQLRKLIPPCMINTWVKPPKGGFIFKEIENAYLCGMKIPKAGYARGQLEMNRIYLMKKLPLGKNYYAICLFGMVFSVRPLSATELNHELIHAAQQKELLYVPFFLWYGIEWALLFIKYRDWEKAYFNIRFEKEAYRHQDDLDYLKHRKLFRYK